ncbi:MAG: ATP-binding protein [Rubricoccaceae bacterium]|nr:ATP-binding protein [Rubricoccaceae bacterium]
MSTPPPSVEKLEKQLRVLKKKLERSEWHRVDLENQHDRDQHLYRRLQADLEAAQREAQIQLALERIRTQSSLMQHSSELVATSAVFHEQLLALGVDTEFSYVWLPEEGEGKHQFWATWTEEEDGAPVHRSRAITYDLDRSEPYTAACFAAWQSDDPIHVDFIPPGDVEGFFATWEELLRGAEHLKPERFPDGLYYAEGYMQYGCFGINIRREPTEEERDILRRFAVEFERAYTRFLDLRRAEAQAREAEIEAALERVRTRAMAMRSSDELGELSFELVKQVQALGVDTWHCAFHIYAEDEERSTEWGANADGFYPTYTIPRVGIFRRYYEIGQSGTDLHVEVIGEDRAADHYEALCAVPGVGEVLLRLRESGVPFPERQVDHVAFFKYGYLIFITFEPAPDAHDVFRRFARVFEQAYTRFLDLQAAEAQAREAQIEAALERVRSRTMGMQKSEELRDIIQVVRDHIVNLDIHAEHAGFIMDYQDRDDMHIWLADDGDVPSEVLIPYFDSPHWNSFRDARASGEKAFTNDLDFEAKNAFYEQLFELIPGVPDEAKDFYLQCPGLSISTVLLDNVGLYIENFSGRPYTDEENRTLMRFGKVFQQAYTRYLDLEQAEARAREAQIEAAMERVRSRALEMTSSEELLDVVFKIRSEFAGLGLECGAFWHTRYTPESYHKALTGIDGQKLAAVMELPRDFASNPALEAWERGDEKIGVFPFDAEAACAYLGHMIAKGKYDEVDPEAFTEAMIREHGGWTFVQARTSHGEIGYSLWGETEPSEEAKDVLIRFTSTFDLAYRRFEDLQQAEARSRETQIEVAIERVRSRALAMTKPDDLLDIIHKIHQEYTGLGLPGEVFWQTRYTPESYHKAVTSAGGGKVSAIMELPRDFSMIPELAAWERGDEKIGVFTFDAEAAAQYVHHMNTKGHFHRVDPEGITPEIARELGGLTFVQARTTHGEIGYALWGETEPSEEAKSVLVRFAATFDLAYRRFLDLQQAEADHQALVEEKALTEQALDELRATQAQLVQKEKLASLGALTAGIAHEIKNPLNFVNNFAGLSREIVAELEEETDPDERRALLDDLRQNAAKIEEHGRRADAIVKAMMEHARSGSGERRPVALNGLVEEYAAHALHAMKVRHEGFEAALSLDLADDAGEVEVEPQEIGRVLINLIDNALDATRQRAETAPGGYAPAVTVATRRTAGGVEVCVSDNGPGMAPEVREKVFEPFFTTKPTGEGTGLGLSMSYDIVTQGHGGRLTVESEPGAGAQFTLTLPAAAPEPVHPTNGQS